MKLVDTHVHFWNPDQLSYPWLDGLDALQRAFLPRDYDEACGKSQVAQMVFVECACEEKQRGKEVAWVTGLARTEPRIAGIVAQVPLEKGDEVREELEELASNPLVKGVRRVLQGEEDPAFCLQPGFIDGVRLLEPHQFSFDLCVHHSQLSGVLGLVQACPEVSFILDHGGKPGIKEGLLDPWRAELERLAACPNVACKISGLLTEADTEAWTVDQLRPYLDHIQCCFGADRVLYAGDWPVCTLAREGLTGWITAAEAFTHGMVPEQQEQFFSSNAERIYRLG